MIGAILALAAVAPQAEDAPRWIWAEDADAQQIRVRCRFELEGAPLSARLRASADNEFVVWVGPVDPSETELGDALGGGSDWSRAYEWSLTDSLAAGENALVAIATNQGGPAGIWFELEVELEDATVRMASGSDCEVTAAESWAAEDFGPPRDLGPLGGEPWGEPVAVLDGTTPRAPDGSGYVVPEGFELELVYSVPNYLQGSWVSICFDPEGRAICGDQDGALWRLDPREDPPLVEPLPVDLGRAQGLLWFQEALYVVVNGGESGLYRATDTDGDDLVDAAELLIPLDGSGEHGPHAVVAHPDGESLVVVCGNHTALPDGIELTRPAPVWDEDQALPRLDDPNGHAVGVMAPGGYALRVDPDGGSRELLAIGMRNAYDLAFHHSGDLFTFDSDMEWDVGLPWYRPARVLCLASGADFGWRHGSGKWPAWVPDSHPAVVDVGLGSPTGVLFPYDAAFPERWRDALLCADWAYGTIWAAHLRPVGAGWEGTAEPFVRGRPMPVTDLAVGPDGAVWYTTGGRGTQSGLYRLSWTGEYDPPESVIVPRGPAEVRRMELERAHGPAALKWLPEIQAGLSDADPAVRHAARVALEHVPVGYWAGDALAEPGLVPAARRLLALVRAAPDRAHDVLARLVELDFDEGFAALADELALEVLRTLEVALARGGAPPEPLAGDLAARLAPLFPHRDARAERTLATLLAALDAPEAAPLLVARLGGVPRETALHHAFCLRAVSRGWTPELRREFAAWLGESARWSGGHSFRPYLDALRDDVRATWPEDERAELEPLLAVEPEPRPVSRRRFVRAWTVAELEGSLPAAAYGRSFERGERLFAEASCATCHPIGGAGGTTGPDLTGAGARFSARDLLVALLEPSAAVSDQYQETQVWLADGGVVVGRVTARSTDGGLAVETADDPPRVVALAPDEIDFERPHPVSRMPAGLLDAFERDEILDLVAYVLAGADAGDPAFD